MAVTATFRGSYVKGYLQYTDVSSGHTLVARPGNTYSVAVAAGWGGQLAALPPDGSWGSGPPVFPAQFSSVPGFAGPGAFLPGSPGTPPQTSGPVMAVLKAHTLRTDLERALAEERRKAELTEEQRLREAGWTGEELALRRAGWTDGDIRRRRQRALILEQRAQFR